MYFINNDMIARFDPQKHHRRSIRLKGRDYTQPGAYFVTLVTWQREEIFGEIVDGEMISNKYGKIVYTALFDLPRHYQHVQLDAICLMPNHLHGIVVLLECDHRGGIGRGGSSMDDITLPMNPQSRNGSMQGRSQTHPYTNVKPRHGLSEIIRALKSFSAQRINTIRDTRGVPVWQRNYYEHIIRNNAEWDRTREYIENNPYRWEEDQENPVFHPIAIK